MKKILLMGALLIATLLCVTACGCIADVNNAESCEHSWENSYSKNDPTCTDDGSITYWCDYCGTEKIEPLPATGHDYQEEERLGVSCEELVARYCCTVCYDWKEEILPATEHVWEEASTSSPTCFYEGAIHYNCKNCDQSKSEPIAMLEHIWQEEIRWEGNCRENGYIGYRCTECLDIREDDIGLGRHTWQNIQYAPCGGEGYFERECTTCRLTENGSTLMLEHDFRECKGQEPTCTQQGYKDYQICDRCCYSTYESIPETNHANAEWEITYAPTETTKGVRELHCTDCGESFRVEMPESIYTDGLIYEEKNGVYYVVGIDRKVNPSATVIRVPLTYMGKQIKGIGEYAFENDTSIAELDFADSKIDNIERYAFYGCTSLNSVKLSDYMNTIGQSAFEGCATLTQVHFQTVDTIDYRAFKNTGIVNLELEQYVGSIASEAFKDCTALKTVSLGSVGSLYSGFLSGCTAIESLKIPYIGTTSPESIYDTTIFAHVFASYSTDMTYAEANVAYVPQSLKTVEITSSGHIFYRAFEGCANIEAIIIPHYYLGNEDGLYFEGCDSLKFNEYEGGLYIATADNPYYMLVGVKDETVTSIEFHEDTCAINRYAFSGSSVTEVTVPNSIFRICTAAFREATSLSTVVLGDGITYISPYAFADCTQLSSVTMSNRTFTIAGYAFYGCTSLERISIPLNVRTIEAYAFKDSGLKYAYFDNTIGWYAGSQVIGEFVSGSDGSTAILTPHLALPDRAATYLKSRYVDDKWTYRD